jgi:hypothetical protein
VKVWLVHTKFVPKSFVMYQLRGARHSWNAPIILLHSSDWNAQVHDVPLPPEDPSNNDPHTFSSAQVTAE